MRSGDDNDDGVDVDDDVRKCARLRAPVYARRARWPSFSAERDEKVPSNFITHRGTISIMKYFGEYFGPPSELHSTIIEIRMERIRRACRGDCVDDRGGGTWAKPAGAEGVGDFFRDR